MLAGLGLSYMPPAQLGESIYGYVSRCALLNGVRLGRVAPVLIGRQKFAPPWTLPKNLEQLSRCFSPVFSSATQILEEHTIIPALLPFMALEKAAHMMNTIMTGAPGFGLGSLLQRTGKLARETGLRRFCIKCVGADRLQLGFAYWHRVHSLEGLTYCAHHGVPLVEGCGRCRFSHRYASMALLPRTKCWCGQALCSLPQAKTKRDRSVAVKVAEYGLALVGGALNGRTTAELGGYYVYQAHRRGLIEGVGFSTGALTSALGSIYSNDLLEMISAEMGPSSWERKVNCKKAPLGVGPNLLLFHFFGGVPGDKDFKDSLAFVSELAAKRARADLGWSEKHSEEQIAWRRKFLLEKMEEHPEATRSYFFALFPSVAEFLSKHDKKWYERHAPSSGRGLKKKSPEEAALDRRALDERASGHVRNRYAELTASEGLHPKLLTKQALLDGLPNSGRMSSRALKRDLPLTRRAIDECLESKAELWERIAMQVLQHYGPHGFEQAWREIRRRNSKFSKEKVLTISRRLWKKWASQ